LSDRLKSSEFLSFSRDPGLLPRLVLARPEGTWIVVDEVQRVPALLREIHSLLSESPPKKYRFALCGSSARRLRRMDADLLAGRVFVRSFLPLTVAEMGPDPDIERLLRFGTLPKVCAEPQHAVDILEAYAQTYLAQEIQQEALVKDIGSFDRFLRVAAIMNGQIVNTAGIARDAGVARPTVQRFFSVLADTLVGSWLPAFQPRLKVKEVQKPKFYFFDPGVVRALAGLIREPVERADRGRLLETLVLHELRAHIAIANIGGDISYWRTPSGSEIDFIWSRGETRVGFEVKSASAWRSEWSRPLAEMAGRKILSRGVGVYLGAQELQDGPIRVLPFAAMARRLASGELLAPGPS
jgi:predicted AAA+ superfamily ATPase